MEEESVLWEAPSDPVSEGEGVSTGVLVAEEMKVSFSSSSPVKDHPAVEAEKAQQPSRDASAHDITAAADNVDNVDGPHHPDVRDKSSGNGHLVRLTLEKEMKLGAKIKSFQDRQEVNGAVQLVEDSTQPLCILVTDIFHNGAAERFGLLPHDRLLLVDDMPVESFDHYKDVLTRLRDRRPLTLTFLAFGCNVALQCGASDGINGSLYGLATASSGSRVDVNAQKGSFDSGFEILSMKSKKQLLVEKHELALMSNNLVAVQHVAYTGLMERYRPVFWRVLLNYLPENVGQWRKVLDSQRALYEDYKKEFLKLGLSSKQDGSSRPSRLKGQGWWEHEAHAKTAKKAGIQHSAAAVVGDDEKIDLQQSMPKEPGFLHPLKSPSLPMQTFSELTFAEQRELKEKQRAAMPLEEQLALDRHEHDVELREMIWKDVQRTHPGLHFFADARCEIMERILFIYAKLNPGVEYVQGMNEVLAPILFVFGSTSPESYLDEKNGSVVSRLELEQYQFEQNYEVDTFFCFCNLMGDLRDLYMQGMDSDEDGIKGKVESLMGLVKVVDNPVYNHLTELDVNPQFFALRWITTLLSRELLLPDTVRLWDSLFSDPSRFTFLLQACCALISLQRDKLLHADFAGCLQLLQKCPPTALEDILVLIERIRHNTDAPLYESKSSTLPTAEQAQSRLKNVMTSTVTALNAENLRNGATTLASATSGFLKTTRNLFSHDSK